MIHDEFEAPTADKELIHHTDTHVTDTPSMRERLARRLCAIDCPIPCVSGACWLADHPDEPAWSRFNVHLESVDAILTEQWAIAQEARKHPGPLTDVDLAGFWAVIQHIREGGS